MQWHKIVGMKEIVYTYKGGDIVTVENPIWYEFNTETSEDNYVTAKDEYITVSPRFLSRRNVPLDPKKGDEIEPWEDF